MSAFRGLSLVCRVPVGAVVSPMQPDTLDKALETPCVWDVVDAGYGASHPYRSIGSPWRPHWRGRQAGLDFCWMVGARGW